MSIMSKGQAEKLAQALMIDSKEAVRLLCEGPQYDPYGPHPSHAVARWLEAIDALVYWSHGVESLHPDRPDIWYLNAGDTYDTTLIFDAGQDKAWAGCWGDLVESI